LFVGIIYTIFSKSMILGASINALLISFSSVLLFNVISFFNNKVNHKVIFWIVICVMNGYASLMFHSSLLLKESWIVFLMLSILYLSIKMINKEKFNWFYFLSILILFLLLKNLRFFIGDAVIGSFFLGWFLNNKFSIYKKIYYGFFMIFIVFFTIFAISKYNIKNIFDAPSIIKIVQPQFISDSRSQYFAGGLTTTNIDVVKKDLISNEYEFSLLGIIRSSFIIVLGPFPWQLSIEKYFLIIPDLFIWYLVLVIAIIGLLKIKLKSSIIYLLPISIMFASLIFGVDNLGALIRYRIPVLIFMSIFTPTGITFIIDYFIKKKHENTIHSN